MKRFIRLLLVLIIAVGFAACGKTEVTETESALDVATQEIENPEIITPDEEPETIELKSTTKEIGGKTFFVSEGLEMLYLDRWVIADMTEKPEDFYFIQADKFIDGQYMDMVYTNIFPDAEVIWDMEGPFTDEKILNKFLEIFSDVEQIDSLEIDGHMFSRFKTHELRDVNDDELKVAVIHFAVVGDDSFLIATGTNDELVQSHYSQDAWDMINSMKFDNVSKHDDKEQE